MTERNDYLTSKIIATITIEKLEEIINSVKKWDCTEIDIYENGQIGFSCNEGYYLGEDFDI